MKIKTGVLLAAIFVFTFLYSTDVKATDQTSLIIQNALNAQQQAHQEAINALMPNANKQVQHNTVNIQQAPQVITAPALTDEQIAQINALNEQQAKQQQALLDAMTAQQKAAQEALAVQMAAAEQAQKSALEAAAAIQEASLVCPQLDTVCDTNCSEQNALLYAKSVPDFVLVDISEQRVIFYKNGLRVLADNCVTGDAKKGLHTSVGIHKIIFKDTNRTLKGSYGTAFVKYWMRFTSGGQGLHDAGWRNNFSSTTYVSNGSHGCVNLKRPTAQTIYENSYIGMFVIVEN